MAALTALAPKPSRKMRPSLTLPRRIERHASQGSSRASSCGDEVVRALTVDADDYLHASAGS